MVGSEDEQIPELPCRDLGDYAAICAQLQDWWRESAGLRDQCAVVSAWTRDGRFPGSLYELAAWTVIQRPGTRQLREPAPHLRTVSPLDVVTLDELVEDKLGYLNWLGRTTDRVWHHAAALHSGLRSGQLTNLAAPTVDAYARAATEADVAADLVAQAGEDLKKFAARVVEHRYRKERGGFRERITLAAADLRGPPPGLGQQDRERVAGRCDVAADALDRARRFARDALILLAQDPAITPILDARRREAEERERQRQETERREAAEREEAERKEAAERERRARQTDDDVFAELLAAQGEAFRWPPDRVASGDEPDGTGQRRLHPEVWEFAMRLVARLDVGRAGNLLREHAPGSFYWTWDSTECFEMLTVKRPRRPRPDTEPPWEVDFN